MTKRKLSAFKKVNKKTKLDVIQSDEKLDGENVSDSESDSGMSDSEQSEESSDLNDAAGNQGKVHSDGPDDDVDKDDGSDVNDDDDNDSDDADDDDGNVNNDANESADVDDIANEGGDDNDDDNDEDGNYEGDDLDDDSDAAGLKDSAKVDVQGKKEAKSDNIHRSNKSVSKRETPLSDADRKKLYKPPTNEELNRLRETENLFHSTLFRLQISEILSEVKVKAKRFKVIDKAVKIVKDIVLSMEPTEKNDGHDWLNQSKVKLPLKEETSIATENFQFIPPVDVCVTGSYTTGTCIRQNMCIDVILKIPKKFFGPKDHMNHRYIRRRALYLCRVAATLCTKPQIDDVKFTYFRGNHLKPIIACTVKVEDTKSIKLYLHAVPESGVFSLTKFTVSKNNVRTSWFQGQEAAKIPPENDVPTPFYNSTILEDILAPDDKITERLEACSNGVKDGIVLLKIWLRQRELDLGFGGFSGYIMTMYVLYLLSKRKLNHQMSSYQIFRNTMLKLKDAEWTTDGISMCHYTKEANIPLQSEFHKHFSVVFVEPSGFLNICYAMNGSTFDRVKHEASLAMSILEDKSINSFDRLFMKRVPFFHKFDHVFHVHKESSFESCVDMCGLRATRYLDYWKQAKYACLTNMLQVLKSGLGKRITLIQTQLGESPTWKVTENPPDDEQKLTFGLMLDSEFAFNVLDRGPSADHPEADEFRKFWGEKSELRRFQDGGICEAVLWLKSKKPILKQTVCKHIVKYILERHCGISSTSESPTVQYFGDQLNTVLTSQVTNEENSGQLMKVYTDLCKILRKLDDLPLTVMSIQGISPCFRYTEVFPPPPCTFKHNTKKNKDDNAVRYIPDENSTCPVFLPYLKVICLMEGSGKWPDDLEAMKRLKAAFLIQMAEVIKTKFNLPVRVCNTHLDVLKDNYVFRLVMAYTKEIDLLRTLKTKSGMVRKRDTQESLALVKEIVSLPKLTSTLHGIQQIHNSFSNTVRLAKRWVCSHMLGDYLQEEAIELLVVYLYLHPAPYTVPKSWFVGFQRFLELLSTFDWNLSPLIVNLNNEFTDEDLQEISTQFTENRNSLPLMFISTPINKLSSHWTASSPTAPILHRLVLLAQTSLDVMHKQINSEKSVDMKQLFRPPLDLYDVLLELDADFIAQPYHQLDVSSHVRQSLIPMQSTSNNKLVDCFPVTDFNPVRLLIQDIRESFDGICLVFHDEYGGPVIGLVWKPEAFQTKDFKIATVKHTMLKLQDGSQPELVQNTDAIIEDIRLMGGRLIKNIKLK